MNFDHGEPCLYEVTWTSGHVETISAHQVTWPAMRMSFGAYDAQSSDERVMFHAEIDGRWQPILIASAADIRTIRNVTVTERHP